MIHISYLFLYILKDFSKRSVLKFKLFYWVDLFLEQFFGWSVDEWSMAYVFSLN